MNPFPKYFTPDAPPVPLSVASPLYAIDLFRLSGPHAPGGDARVLLDAAGKLSLSTSDDAGLSPRILQAIQTQGLTGHIRSLDVAQVSLFALERMTAGPEVPGINDPVLLHGTLFGPFPGTNAVACHGALSVTRADVLDGFVRGLAAAFHCPRAEAGATQGRWLHLHLPAHDADALRLGRGTVLAYPLHGSLLDVVETGNVALTLSLMQELLDEIRRDPSAQGSTLALEKVPTASREALETALEARGFAIEGEVAIRNRAGLLGSLLPDRVLLPPQGTVGDFAMAALRAVKAMPHWPNERTRIHRERVRVSTVEWDAGEPHGLLPVLGFDRARCEVEGGELVSPPAGRSFSLDLETRLTATWRPLYVVVDPSFARWNSGRMDLEVEFRATALGDLSAEIEVGGATAKAKSGTRIGANPQWETARLTFDYALILGQQEQGAGLRLCIRSPEPVRVRRLSLKAQAPLPFICLPPAVPPLEAFEIPEGDRRLDLSAVSHEVGCSYYLAFDSQPPGDTMEAPRQSTVALFENSVALGPAHSPHAEVREKGCGRFSHWGQGLYFSTSDNTDPRTNGRVYTVRRTGG